jgi:putative CocE/NonD family hydrolase
MGEGLWFVNWTGPDKMGMGGWSHANSWPPVDAERAVIEGIEHHRWFDFWLKGIDNGIMDEAPINYAVVDVPGQTWSWSTADSWPPAEASTASFFFAAGPSGSVGSVNDGLLGTEAPADAGADEYTVNLTTTTSAASRWDNAVGAGTMVYPDMTANDEKSLTYTTAPLERDLTVVGHPVVTLFVTSSASDGDFVALLEEVDAGGVSQYLSEGMMRVSHRTPATAPWDNLGLPYQTSFKGDLDPLEPGEMAELRFDLQPLAVLFNAGNRIRVTIMGTDKDNTETPPGGTPTIQLHRSKDLASRIELPVLGGE